MNQEKALKIIMLALLGIIVALLIDFAFFNFLPSWIDYNSAIKYFLDNCPHFKVGGI